ncbi:MAG: RHS repeat protein, partial [Muribaculaceae bacterium]|nr:RHS repeat protein [Muribaculaceae bacterium]
VMRERGEAEFILYDPIGRVAVCGITADGLPQTVPVMTARYDSGNIAGSIGDTGYTVPSDLDWSDITITRVNYYDSYDCLQQKGFASLPAENFTPDLDTAKGMLVAARTAYYTHSDSGYDVSGTDESLYSVYCYDKEGRVTTEVSSTIIEGIYHTVTHGYSRQGHETECTEHINVTEPQCLLKRTTEYDALGNILSATAVMGSGSSLNPGTVRSPEYIYDELGRLSQVRAGITVGYRYDMRGRLTGISHPAFSQTIEYESGRSPRYNGNISEITTSRNDEYPDIRIFGYDRLNRLTSMSSVYRFSTQYSYDLNSGPLTIRRSGLLSDGTVGVVDDLSLTYDGNRLIKVTDDADPVLLERSCDFYGQESVYGYNADGALYSDTSRGIEAIEYAPAGQPVAIRDADGILIARYAYSADGRRLSSGYSTVPGQEPTGNRHFIGSFEVFKYDRDIMNRTMLERIRIPWGEILYDNTALLHMRDYQGNVCAVIEPVSGGVAQTTEYYPYGLPTASSTGQVQNTYKFSGKTFEAYRGMNRYDFHARQYDPALGLFDR